MVQYGMETSSDVMDNGTEKMAPPPVPTHRRPEMTVRDEIWSGASVRKAWPNVLVTKALKSTSCSGRPVDQSNSLRIGSSRQDAQTPLPPAHRKRTCCSLRSDTENICSTFLLSMSTMWTLFQYPTHKRPPFARQQRMGCTGFDPRGISECDCRFHPPELCEKNAKVPSAKPAMT